MSTRAPSLKLAERMIGLPATQWGGKCFQIASALVEHKLVEGTAVYGHWIGPVAKGSIFFDKSALGFCQHGWVNLGGGLVCDPTRWAFEDVAPYIYLGASDHYDEGGNRFRERTDPTPPEWDEFEEQFELDKRVLPNSDAWNRVEKLLRLDDPFELPEDYSPGMVTREQLMWLAKRSPTTLGEHAFDIYNALAKLDLIALIPIDNRLAVERAAGKKLR